ncbi:Molybdopterin synthase catalytic subunit [Halioglobus japonicus]|nr:Molybdopterin synthase catalytic subunit [Halioglobus japonicus]
MTTADTMQLAFTVSVQEADFDIAQLQRSLLAGAAAEGAIATFTGYVRRDNENRQVEGLELEHYPGMTEASISAIIEQAAKRWPLLGACVVHRVGKLVPGDQIVWVGIASAHREAAFSACECIMDFLKTQAPFWKKEQSSGNGHWVEPREIDSTRAARWHEDTAE